MKLRIMFLIIGILIIKCGVEEKEIIYFEGTEIVKYEVDLKNGKRYGTAKKYNLSGNVIEVSQWVNGKKEGNHVFYYPNGHIKATAPFKNGIQEGIVREYDSLGNLFSEYHFKDSLVEGKYREYYSNGQLAVEANMEQNILHGSFRQFNKQGKLDISAYYDSGNIVYYKEYINGEVKKSKLPIMITESNDSIYIKLELSDIHPDSVAIVTYLGHLNAANKLLEDTIAIKSEKGLKMVVSKKFFKENQIEGLLYEIKYPNIVEGKYHFHYNFN